MIDWIQTAVTILGSGGLAGLILQYLDRRNDRAHQAERDARAEDAKRQTVFQGQWKQAQVDIKDLQATVVQLSIGVGLANARVDDLSLKLSESKRERDKCKAACERLTATNKKLIEELEALKKRLDQRELTLGEANRELRVLQEQYRIALDKIIVLESSTEDDI